MREMLRAARAVLEARFSYLGRVPVDLDAFEATEPRPRETPAMTLARALAPFDDGHTRVVDWLDHVPPAWLPCRLRPVGDRVLALGADHAAPLDAGRPWLVAIDGVPLDDARAAVGAYLAGGSPAWRRCRHTAALAWLGLLRVARDLPDAPTVALTLAGDDERTRTLPVRAEAFPRRTWPDVPSGMRDGVAYLRIPRMAGEAAAGAAREALAALDMTGGLERGLVIDVRGNGGGSRHALRAVMASVLGGPRPSAHVASVAAYRRDPGEPRRRAGGWLVDRFMHLDDALHWTPAARAAIAALDFTPSWPLDPDRFTDWHTLVVEADPDAPRAPGPVVLLTDERCYSATDIFAGAFVGLPGVTRVGQPTSGGSGRAKRHALPGGLSIQVSTMASYRPDGLLYEANGTAPQVVVPPSIDDWLPGRDPAFEAARECLR